MQSVRLMYKSSLCGILLMVLAILFILSLGPANSASEPGTVTVLMSAEPLNLDPDDYNRNDVGKVLAKNVVETLTDMNRSDSSIVPKLATSWKQIDDKTWHFFLRKGVKFHDGEDFNAEAAVFSIKRLFNKKLNSNLRVVSFSNIKMEGKAIDSHTLELRTDKPEPLLLVLMSNLPVCSPNTPFDKLIRNPIGTGPYKFVKWDPGAQIILENFAGYWGKQPQVKKAIYVWRTESSVQAAMVLIGEADLAASISKQDANRPDMDFTYLNYATTYVRMMRWEPPLNDKRVRMALNLAVDRDAIRGAIFGKDVVPATQIVVPGVFGHNPDLKVWPYDPKKARQLLDEARKEGVPVDKEISLVGRIGHYPGNAELLEAMMTMYRAIGLNVKLRMLEVGVYARYRIEPFVTGEGPYMINHTHDNTNGDAAFTVYPHYHCPAKGTGSASATCDKTLDALIEKAEVATGEERRSLWRAAFKRIHEEIISDVVLFHMVSYCRVGKRINFNPSLLTQCELPLAEITFKQ